MVTGEVRCCSRRAAAAATGTPQAAGQRVELHGQWTDRLILERIINIDLFTIVCSSICSFHNSTVGTVVQEYQIFILC